MKETLQNSSAAEQPPPPSVEKRIVLYLKNQGVGIYLVLGAVILVTLGFGFYTIKTKRANDQASRLLAVAQTPKQFEDLLSQYPKTTTAPAALLALASSQYSAGLYDAALERYREFSDKYPAHPMFAAAELGKVMCSEARGEMEKALMEFEAFIQTHPGHFLVPQALFGKARCLQATGKLTEARTIYEDFIAGNPESKWRLQSESAMQALDRQVRLQRAAAKPAGKE